MPDSAEPVVLDLDARQCPTQQAATDRVVEAVACADPRCEHGGGSALYCPSLAARDDPCFCRAVPSVGGGGCGKPGCPRGPELSESAAAITTARDGADGDGT